MSVSSPLRVAYLTRYLPSASETFVLDEATSLFGAGVEVKVWALDTVPGAVRHARFEPIYRGADLVPRASSPRTWGVPFSLGATSAAAVVGAHWRTVAKPRDLRRVAWLARAWRNLNVDIVRVHHGAEIARYGVAAALLAGIPASVAVHARDLYVPLDDLLWILGQASQISTLTHFQRQALLRMGLPSEHVRLLPCATAAVDKPALRPDPEGALRLISVGRLVPKKGHDLLLRACALAAESRPVSLVIVGEGEERLALRKLADQLVVQGGAALRVEFRGALPVEEVEILLSGGRFHAFALACRVAADGDRDGIPVALLEAQAHGLPVITSALPGMDEVFRPGEGALLVGVGPVGACIEPAVETLCVALLGLAKSPTLQRKLAERARMAAAQRPTPADIGERLAEMLRAVCSTIPVDSGGPPVAGGSEP